MHKQIKLCFQGALTLRVLNLGVSYLGKIGLCFLKIIPYWNNLRNSIFPGFLFTSLFIGTFTAYINLSYEFFDKDLDWF